MYGIMRLAKYQRSAVHGVGMERNREKDDDRNFARSDIDKELTDQNVVLHEKDCEHFNNEISRQIKNAGVKERPDSIVMMGGLFTASAEYFTQNPDYIPKDEMAAEDLRTPNQRQKFLFDEKAKQFFEDCYQFYVKEYCQGDASRVFSAKVDMDETSPHLQIYSVPLQDRERNGVTKTHLSAKNIFGNRSDMRAHQDRFFEDVSKSRGLERGDKVDWDKSYEERKKHEATIDYKRRTEMAQNTQLKAENQLLSSQLDEIADEYDRVSESVSEVKKTLSSAKKELSDIKDQIEAGNARLEVQAQAAQVLAKPKKKMFQKSKEGLITVNAKEYQDAVGQTAALKRLMDNPMYGKKELAALARKEEALDQKLRSAEQKLANIDSLVEERAAGLLKLNNHIEAMAKVTALQELKSLRNDHNYVLQCMRQFLEDNRFSVKEFEEHYGFSLSQDGGRDDHSRDEMEL